jgi:hypothetical protein
MYRHIDIATWLGERRPLLFDANAVLTTRQIEHCRTLGVPLWIVGRGLVTPEAT